MKRPVTNIGADHYQMVVQHLSVDQLLKLQEKLLDEEDSFELQFGDAGKDVWAQCWDVVEQRIQQIA